MSQSILLPLLADGEFRSGQDLADAMGVSRTAVWKQINKLSRDTGVAIESVKGRGYRVKGGLDLLNASDVESKMSPVARRLLQELVLLDTIDSTNAEAARRAGPAVKSGLVVTAEQQSAGRGRRGRQWVSPYASNLYVSLLWEFEQGAAALEGLSLAVGVAAVRALTACGVSGVALKWPNDVLAGGRKLGGILIEISGDATGSCQVVIGIGINVAMPEDAGQSIDQAWTDVQTLAGGKAPGRGVLLAALLDELLPLATQFQEDGFPAWRDAWMALDAYADTPVVLDTGATQLAGIARGVDDRGGLNLETTVGVQTVYGGEISMRGAT